jgi:putative tryptophan/tyrosine transport system substrate-binding protein
MKRREFIAGLGGVAAWPRAGHAQQAAMPTVGLLMTASASSVNAAAAAAFRGGLGELGFVEGRNIAIEYRYAQNDVARLPELAADLVRRRVAAIATSGGMPPIRAAMAASTTTPIVFETGGDPVAAGLVASLNRPGGNATGVLILAAELGPKHLALLQDLLPAARRFAALINPTDYGPSQLESRIAELKAAATAIGAKIDVLFAATNDEIDAAFANISQKRAEALVLIISPLFADREVQIATLALRYGIPTIFSERHFAAVGGLMSYGTNYFAQVRQVGVYVGRILKGEKAADLPVLQPTKFELIINLQTARTLGLEIPPMLLALADEVIE